MFWREGNNPPRRLDKFRDAVYGDAVGHATDWLPIQNQDSVAIEICRAVLKAAVFSPPGNQLFDIIPEGRSFPQATVVLEHKYGGTSNRLARPMEEFTGQVVSTNSMNVPRGFIRLRITNITSLAPDGIYMSIAKHSPST